MLVKIRDFVPQQTFECGQCFRWERQPDGSYIGVAGGRCVRISSDGENVKIDGCTEEDYELFWKKYLDAERDYSEIKRNISINPLMERAIGFGSGIRILKQEFFETLLSFIISQRSSIPRIKTCVKRLCERYGKPIEFEGKTFYAFPTPEELSGLTAMDFAQLGVGYRAEYLAEAVRAVNEGRLVAEVLENADTQTAREELLKIKGIGDKVCDCISLFSLGKFDLFPSDIWIKRVMAEQFTKNDAKKYGENLFGKYSGFAQQYLFYWRKEAEEM